MRHGFFLSVIVIASLLSGCNKPKEPTDFYTSDLFRDVQLKPVFPDSKTFVDCTPKRDIQEIMADYDDVKDEADFDLAEFVRVNFDQPVRPKSTFSADTA